MTRRAYWKYLIVVVILGLFAAACGGGADTDEPAEGDAAAPTEGDAAAPEETEGGDAATGDEELVDFIWAGPALPDTTDTTVEAGPIANILGAERAGRPFSYATADLEGQGCDQLPSIADIEPELAESWEWNEDETVLTMKFKEGIMSPFGNELTSEDVKFSFDRMLELSGTMANFQENLIFWEDEDPVQIVEDYTVSIAFEESGSLDLAIFSYNRFLILDYTEAQNHITDADPWATEFFESNSANFGPWHFTEEDFESGQELIMTRNPNYYAPEELGNIGRVVMRVIPEASTRAQLVASGEIDYAGQLAPTDYAELEEGGQAQVLNCSSGDRDTLVLNTADERFADVNVRRAVSMAIDREALSQAAYAGYALPATDGLHQAFEFPEPESRITYDPEQAQELLAEAGYPDGFAAEMALSPGRPGPQAEQIGINLQSQLADIGLDFDIQVVASPPEFQTMFLEGQYQSIIYQQPPAVPDPAYTAQLYNMCGGYQNSFGYCNEEYDELQQQVLQTEPGEERAQLMSELASVIVETVPQVYLLDTTLLRAFSAAVDISTYHHHPYATTVHIHKLVKNAE